MIEDNWDTLTFFFETEADCHVAIWILSLPFVGARIIRKAHDLLHQNVRLVGDVHVDHLTCLEEISWLRAKLLLHDEAAAVTFSQI